jgi:hypothetical protein
VTSAPTGSATTSIGHIQVNAGCGQAVPSSPRLSGQLLGGVGRCRAAKPKREQAVSDRLDPHVVLSRQAGVGRADLLHDAVQLVGGQRRPGGQHQHLGGQAGVGSKDLPGALDRQRAGGAWGAASQLDVAADMGDVGLQGRIGG